MCQEKEEKLWTSERRLQARTEIEVPAEYRILTRSKLFLGVVGREPSLVARVKNLSAGGVLLLVWQRLMQHSVLSLLLQLPGKEEPVKSLAEVRHLQELFHSSSQPYAVGLEFLSISTPDLSAITQLVGNAKSS